MAKSKKKVSKKKELVSAKKYDPTGVVVGLIISAVLLGALFYFLGGKTYSIEKGQCYMDRSYKPLIVETVWRSLGDVWFFEAEIREVEGSGWYVARTSNRFSYDRERTVEFVEQNYTLIPCENLRVRE